MEIEYWQHERSGEVVAVLLDDGVVKGFTDPLPRSEVTAKNLRDRNFNFDSDDEETWDDWRSVTV